MIQNKLSNSYNTLFKNSIESFQATILPTWNESEWFTCFYPSLSNSVASKADFLFYGQAVGGWEAGFDLHDLIDEKKLNEIILHSNQYLPGICESPLHWVNIRYSDELLRNYKLLPKSEQVFGKRCYNRKGESFFWSLIYKTVNDFLEVPRNSFEWANKVVWSNLYKINDESKGNPKSSVRKAHFDSALKLVKLELDEIQPKYCIVATNEPWWKPFGEYLNTDHLEFDKEFSPEIQSVQKYNETLILVCERPFRGDAESHVNKINILLKDNHMNYGFKK